MVRRLGIAIGIFICACSAQVPAWTYAGPAQVSGAQVGPLAGPIAAVASTGTGPLYAAGLGGLWQYASGGWSELTQGPLQQQSLSALALSNGVLYAGTGDVNDGVEGSAGNGILTNASGTWQLVGAATFAGLAITRIVPIASTGTLLASGVTEPDSPATAQPGLYASLDGGVTWAQLLAGEVWDFAVDASGTVMVAATAAGLEVSQDGGVSFTVMDASAQARAAACLTPGGSFLVLVSGSPPRLLNVNSAGSSETTTALPATLTSIAPEDIALAAGSSAIWVGAFDLWQLDLATRQWTNVTQAATPGSVMHSGQHVVLLDGSGGFWLGNDGGVWRETSGASLQEQNGSAPSALANYALQGIAPGSAAAWASLDGGGVAAGASSSAWTATDLAQNFTALAADAADSTGVYAVLSGSLMHSSDGGQTWTAVTSGPTGITAITAGAAGPPWVMTAQNQLIAPDGTATAGPAGAGTVTSLAVSDGTNPSVWAADGQVLWFSARDGAAWTAISAPTASPRWVAVDPLRPNLVAVASRTGVWASLDGGQNWAAVSPGGAAFPSAPITGLAFDAHENLWAITLGAGAWRLPLTGAGMQLQLTAAASSATVGGSVQLAVSLTQLGSPVAGASVSLSATEAGVTVWTANAVTSSAGTATISFPLPKTAGEISIGAFSDGAVAGATISAVPGPPATIVVISGDGQSQVNGTALLLPIVLQVQDANANGVPGVNLSLSGPGSFGPVAASDSSGKVTVSYSLPTQTGPITLAATADGITTTWTETALPTPDYSLVFDPPSAPAQPDQVVPLTLHVAAIGGWTQAVPLTCLSPVPGCSITPATVSPGSTAVVSVDVGAFAPDQTSETVTVASGNTHTASVTLSIAGFTLAAGASTLAVTAGGSAPPLTLSATPVNGFAGQVSFAVTLAGGNPLPASLSALVNPAQLTVAANGTNAAQLMISASAAAGGVPVRPEGGWPGLLLAASLCALEFLRQRKKVDAAGGSRCSKWRWCRLAALAGGALVLAGCGGGGSPAFLPQAPTPTISTYTLQVTATGNNVQATVPLQLSVTSN